MSQPSPPITSEKFYRLPLCGVVLSEKALWGKEEKPILLRPKDLEKFYGIPVASVNDMVYRASEMASPLPFIKLERKTLIPRAAFEAWILNQAHVTEVTNENRQ